MKSLLVQIDESCASKGSADRERWAFISFIVAGQVPNGRWGGQVLVTTHEEGRPARRFTAVAPPD